MTDIFESLLARCISSIVSFKPISVNGAPGESVLPSSAAFVWSNVVERECKSSNERDFRRSIDTCGGTRPFPLGCCKSTDIDRETFATMGDVELVGSFIVNIEDVDVLLADGFERCEGILGRRGLNGDFRIDSIRDPFGL